MLITQFSGLCEMTGRRISCCMVSGVTGILPSFEGENANIYKLAFIMMVMLFVLGIARIVFRRRRDE